jgi:glycosyltransferase involved in cell wall biosynthesis
MRILVSSRHRYPSSPKADMGMKPVPFPSGSAFHLQDLLARGLAEAGHEVFYLLEKGASEPLPAGVTLVSELSEAADAIDVYSCLAIKGLLEDVGAHMDRTGTPWVAACHLDVRLGGRTMQDVRPNWVFVSKKLAAAHGSSRYVLNGLDPGDYIFEAKKSDYLLFMSALDRWEGKGLATALRAARLADRRLVVAGTARTQETIDRIAEMCHDFGAEYVGDVRGERKARLLAGAAALLFPSELNEGCPLVLIEALMSGTPAISARGGGSPEIVSADTGFLCGSDREFADAIAGLPAISPEACRERGLRHFHYRRMAEGYVREYEAEIRAGAGCGRGAMGA